MEAWLRSKTYDGTRGCEMGLALFAWLSGFIPLRPVASVAKSQVAKASYSSKGGESAPLSTRAKSVQVSRYPRKAGRRPSDSTRYLKACANTPVQRVYMTQNSDAKFTPRAQE